VDRVSNFLPLKGEESIIFLFSPPLREGIKGRVKVFEVGVKKKIKKTFNPSP